MKEPYRALLKFIVLWARYLINYFPDVDFLE